MNKNVKETYYRTSIDNVISLKKETISELFNEINQQFLSILQNVIYQTNQILSQTTFFNELQSLENKQISSFFFSGDISNPFLISECEKELNIEYKSIPTIFSNGINIKMKEIQNNQNTIQSQTEKDIQFDHLFKQLQYQNELRQLTLEKSIEIKLKRVKSLISFVGKQKENEIKRDMNKIIQLYQYDPDKLEKCWKTVVDTYAPGHYF